MYKKGTIRRITHYTMQQLYYYADDELVEVLGNLPLEEREKVRNHVWANGRILSALDKLEPVVSPEQ